MPVWELESWLIPWALALGTWGQVIVAPLMGGRGLYGYTWTGCSCSFFWGTGSCSPSSEEQYAAMGDYGDHDGRTLIDREVTTVLQSRAHCSLGVLQWVGLPLEHGNSVNPRPVRMVGVSTTDTRRCCWG